MIEFSTGAPYTGAPAYQFDVPLSDGTFHTVVHTAGVSLSWAEIARLAKEEFLAIGNTHPDCWYTVDGLIDDNPAVIVFSRK